MDEAVCSSFALAPLTEPHGSVRDPLDVKQCSTDGTLTPAIHQQTFRPSHLLTRLSHLSRVRSNNLIMSAADLQQFSGECPEGIEFFTGQ